MIIFCTACPHGCRECSGDLRDCDCPDHPDDDEEVDDMREVEWH